MPLSVADDHDEPIDPLKVPRFVIFYASIVDGTMWCPDCRRVEDLVNKTFSDQGPDGLIVYVGTRTEWKDRTNRYRQEQWNISNVPTIVKMQDGKEIGRLDDDNKIENNLVTFVKS